MSAKQAIDLKKTAIDWLGILPFLLFAVMFLIAPTLYLVTGAFLNPAGEFTFDNISGLFTDKILASYWISIRVSLASSVVASS